MKQTLELLYFFVNIYKCLISQVFNAEGNICSDEIDTSLLDLNKIVSSLDETQTSSLVSNLCTRFPTYKEDTDISSDPERCPKAYKKICEETPENKCHPIQWQYNMAGSVTEGENGLTTKAQCAQKCQTSGDCIGFSLQNDYDNNICEDAEKCDIQKCFIYKNTNPDPIKCKYNVFTDDTNADCLYSTRFGSFCIDREEINNRIDSTINLNSFSVGYEQGRQSVS